jgi:hypothetical protein
MATYSWANGTSGDWNTGTLWSGGTVPNTPSADVVIDAPPAGVENSYTITLGAGETATVNSIALNADNNKAGPNSNPYVGAVLQVGEIPTGGAALIFGPDGDGSIRGPLQNWFIVENGSTIVNAGTIDAFVQAIGGVLFTQDGSSPERGIYFTNWLQALGGTVTIASKIAEYDEGTNTLWDGIFEAKGPEAVVNLGGKDLAGTDHIVTIDTMTGPPNIPEGWTQLLFEEGGQINQWDGKEYVSVASTLTRIENRATLTINNSNYTTPDTFSVGTLAAIHQTGGTLTTGTLTIENGGSLQAVGTLIGNVINNGAIFVTPGAPLVNGNPTGMITRMTFQGSITGNGIITFTNDGTLEVGAVGTGETVIMDGDDTLVLDDLLAFQGVLRWGTENTIILKNVVADSATWLTTNELQISYQGTVVDTITTAGDYSGAAPFTVTMSGADATLQVVCFVRGTRIRTPDGDVPIEELKPGQRVVTMDGNIAAIKWIGHRRVNCGRHPDPRKVWPVRVQAGAFGRGLPRRDLLVSPQHALFTEGVLIPARYLINGHNVVQQEVDSIEYFHIELGCHDILLAEGLPAESYLDTGDRKNFDNNKGPVALHPDFGLWCWDSRACAELKVTGAEVDAVRARLLARARASRRSRRVAAA